VKVELGKIDLIKEWNM